MAKDPSFLMYSKDFLEGTAEFEPDELGAYIRLLCHQHQRGYLPLEINKLCRMSGFLDVVKFKQVWEQVLKHKFKQTPEGFANDKLQIVMDARREYGKKQSVRGTIGQFIKKCKAEKTLTAKQIQLFKDQLYKEKLTPDNISERLSTCLKHTLKHKGTVTEVVNGNEIGIEDVNTNKDIIHPFDSEEWLKTWDIWKQYKWDQFKFKYKSELSEQAALKQISKKYQTDTEAIEAIENSMGNGYKGIFKENSNGQTNGKQPNDGGKSQLERLIRQDIATANAKK